MPESWSLLLDAQRRLQSIVPGAVLVGGAAAALHAGHRVSLDGEHVLEDLRDRFEEVLSRLEATEGWKTEHVRRPVMILGELDQFMTGVRQLRRSRPVEAQVVAGLTVPTLSEMARIKGWMLLQRDTTRDLLDTVALMERLGEPDLGRAFAAFNEIYLRGPGAGLPLVELAERLGAARPADRTSLELQGYKGLKPPWNDWSYVEERARLWAARLAALSMQA